MEETGSFDVDEAPDSSNPEVGLTLKSIDRAKWRWDKTAAWTFDLAVCLYTKHENFRNTQVRTMACVWLPKSFGLDKKCPAYIPWLRFSSYCCIFLGGYATIFNGKKVRTFVSLAFVWVLQFGASTPHYSMQWVSKLFCNPLWQN